MIKLFILLSILVACSSSPERNTTVLSASEKERLNDEYGTLLEQLSVEIKGTRPKPLVCMDINRLKSIGLQLDRDQTARSSNNDELYSAPLKSSALREYCQFNQSTKNLELNSLLRAQNQLQQAKNRWLRLNQ